MSDFVIRKKEGRTSEAKTVSFVKPTSKALGLILKVVLFIVIFSGLIFMSMNNGNLMLTEILLSGGILALVLFIHVLSNR